MISAERWQRVRPILDGALDLGAADDVAAYLDRSCAGDPTLRREVERLLAATKPDRASPGLLDRQFDKAFARLLADAGADLDVPDRVVPGQVLGPYRVVRRIGQGGMGVVHLAHDARLDRHVALKLLPPWLAADAAAARRLTDEARAASALDHPNLATVYDIGTAGEAGLYIAMAYCDGETLEARIRRGPLEPDEARAIAIQLADGLRAAHGKGIVHRDVKPSNVILTRDGVVKLVDFGLARMATRAVTTPGLTPGTVAYMSPEQTVGGDVDARSDIWALGVVLYEMLTGRRPFTGDQPAAVLAAIRYDAPAPIASARPDVPARFARAVMRCLVKDPSGRWAGADALLAALQGDDRPPARSLVPRSVRRVALWGTGAVLTLIAGAAVVVDRLDDPGRPAAAGAHRIAVLPLADAGVGPTEAYFAAGMTGELISRLSKLRGLHVIGATSVRPYQAPDRDLAEVARALDVRSIVEGRVSVADDRVVVAVWLLDGASEERRWEEEYDVAQVDMPGVQRDIAEQIATALQITIDAAERRHLGRRGTAEPDAYRAYLRGRYWLGRSDAASYSRARDEFQAALDRDPTYALAWAGLSDALDHLAGSGALAATEAYPRARAAAERALDLDPDLPEAHASLAMALTAHYWEIDLAERHFRRALELSPSYARAHRTYATHLRNECRLDEAFVEAETAAALDPLDFFSHYETTIALYMARRYDDAIAHADRLVTLGFAEANLTAALARTQQRAYPEALAALADLETHPHARAIRGHVYGRMGRTDDARRLLATFEDAQPGAGFLRAVIHLGLDETAAALRWLDRAVEERSWMLRLLKAEPLFDPLRADPRFLTVVARAGFRDARSCAAPGDVMPDGSR